MRNFNAKRIRYNNKIIKAIEKTKIMEIFLSEIDLKN